MNKKLFLHRSEASEMFNALGEEFVIVKNPDYIHPAYELYPLAPKIFSSPSALSAFVMDMDGTTTTTEELCLHSLEFMIRRMSGKMTKEEWAGLDHTLDYPHIIGNSTTKHVEYLIAKYQEFFDTESTKTSFVHSALWTLAFGKDRQRREEVMNNIVNFGLSGLTDDPKFINLLQSAAKENGGLSSELAGELGRKYFTSHTDFSFSDHVRLGIDIYYQRYHEILERIRKGESDEVSKEIFAGEVKNMIEPMPGVLIFNSLIKGWLGSDIIYCLNDLLQDYRKKTGISFSTEETDALKAQLLELSVRYEASPAKSAIVTSSIFYEADIVLREIMSVLTRQISCLPLPEGKKKLLSEKFSDYRNVYDAVITASDSSEIRLKPHRDLYSIALHQLHVPKDKFHMVAGFEDSESGTIAIRASGIGLCVAVPFAQTSGHNLDAAAYVCQGGLPEVLLKHNLFLK